MDEKILELIRKVKVDNNLLALDELLSYYQDKIYNISYYLCNRDEEVAKELTQDVLLKIAQSIKDLKVDSAFDNWVYRIAKNTYLKKYSKMLKSSYKERDDPQETFKDPFSEFIDKKIMQEKIIESLNKLPPLYKTVIILREVENLSYKEIAEICGMKVNTAKSINHRAKIFLRNSLRNFKF